MAIYAIGDLHLSFQENKPMSIFGVNWKNHEEKIKEDWLSKVNEEDLVILLGDFSWAMDLKNTYLDFKYLNELPGQKLLLKGNHDYWWNTVTKMRKYLQENNFKNIGFLYNNSYEYENKIIVGTRGWIISNEEEDKKLIKREANRLEYSIQDGIKKFGEDKEIMACMHYPPITISELKNNGTTEFIKVMQKYNIKRCIYGHLHSTAIQEAVEGNVYGIELKLVSADALDFKLWDVSN